MKTFIHELGVLDKLGRKHVVRFKQGLNVVTGKSSTGKSALIEIFDYCFGSSEYTVPKGVITESADTYYVYLQIEGHHIVIARRPAMNNKAFLRKVEGYDTEIINKGYFDDSYFRPIEDFKKSLRSYFIIINDVDESLFGREKRSNRKSPTPTIRSFTSFMLQHQNLIANKHALFYRFDEKEKRDQIIDHIKMFLGFVDQDFFIFSQEREQLLSQLNGLKREQDAKKKVVEKHKEHIAPMLDYLYSLMGSREELIPINQVLWNPQQAIHTLERLIVPERIVHSSNASTEYYIELKKHLNAKTAELRALQRQASSINHHIREEDRFIENSQKFTAPDKVHIATITCPFCQTEQHQLSDSAKKLQNAITKISHNVTSLRPMRAKFQTSLADVNRKIEEMSEKVNYLSDQVKKIEITEKQIEKEKSLYETILKTKANLIVMLETLNSTNESELDEQVTGLRKRLKEVEEKLEKYNVKKDLEAASAKVNQYMKEIGEYFEFEDSYRPINLHFSFETFDLYHETDNEKIYLRSMGSGANWLYSHVTLFLALHKYFAELGHECAIPTILFLDQPTQVYFPNFKRDNSETFDQQKALDKQNRSASEREIDEDIKAVENLFSRLSIYCQEIEAKEGFSPQIIVSDHADDLTLSNGVLFDSLVNGNRWRKRGLIHPVPPYVLL